MAGEDVCVNKSRNVKQGRVTSTRRNTTKIYRYQKQVNPSSRWVVDSFSTTDVESGERTIELSLFFCSQALRGRRR